MRFLATGSLQSARGPRRLVTLGLVFFAVFLLLQWVRLHLEEIPPEGLPSAALLEALHLDAFFFGTFFLFVEAVRLRLPGGNELFFWLDLLSIALIMILRFVAGNYPFLHSMVLWFFVPAFLWLFLSLGRLTTFMYRS
ncbi:MAG: hypothetical protein HS115_03385 [Spirochaetales bacterium]|nr:hypothetical protein [Spirochaetales bacterium]